MKKNLFIELICRYNKLFNSINKKNITDNGKGTKNCAVHSFK